jgi:hypothetical protein
MTAGTSGTTQPIFDDSGGMTPDGTGTLVWTDKGLTVSSFTLSSNITTPGWAIGTIYPITSSTPNVNQILDPNGHIQQVLTPGTSGTLYPPFNQSEGTTNDNAVTWTDQGNWQPNTKYYSLTQTVGDTNLHLHMVGTPGRSGAGPNTPAGDWQTPTTNDNEVMWINQGIPGTWAPNTQYTLGLIVVESTIIQQVTSVADNTCTSGGNPSDTAPNQSTTGWNQTAGGTTSDGTCTWTDLGVPPAWTPDTAYSFIVGQVGQIVAETCGESTCIQQVTTAGTSGPAQSNVNQQPFSGWTQTVPGSTTDGLTWTDEGTRTWQASHAYTQATSSTDPNGVVVDPSGHVQKVVAAADAGTSGPFQPGTTPPPRATRMCDAEWRHATL